MKTMFVFFFSKIKSNQNYTEYVVIVEGHGTIVSELFQIIQFHIIFLSNIPKQPLQSCVFCFCCFFFPIYFIPDDSTI